MIREEVMAFIFSNPNPRHALVGDCVIRALSLATGKTWDEIYAELCVYGFMSCDMPSSNAVWGQYLSDMGFERSVVSDSCPSCTVRDFSFRHPVGTFVLGTGTHVVTVIDGDYMDAWDSGDETPIFVWRKRNGI